MTNFAACPAVLPGRVAVVPRPKAVPSPVIQLRARPRPVAMGPAETAREILLAGMASRAGFRVTEVITTETEFGLEVQMTGEGRMIFEIFDL